MNQKEVRRAIESLICNDENLNKFEKIAHKRLHDKVDVDRAICLLIDEVLGKIHVRKNILKNHNNGKNNRGYLTGILKNVCRRINKKYYISKSSKKKDKDEYLNSNREKDYASFLSAESLGDHCDLRVLNDVLTEKENGEEYTNLAEKVMAICSPKEKEILNMFKYETDSSRVAQRLCIPASTVRVTKHRVRQKCFQRLQNARSLF